MDKRPYAMTNRALAAAQTRERIIDAAAALFMERDVADITLDAVAELSGVTLQTVLRRFGSKDGLFEAAAAERAGDVMARRKPPAPDARSAVHVLVSSYEELGEMNWRMLRHEHQQPLVAKLLANARRLHREWIATSFSDRLPAGGPARERCVDALFTALDFYVWKLHRKDLGRSRARTEAVMLALVEAITKVDS